MDLKTFLKQLQEEVIPESKGQEEIEEIMAKVRRGEKLTNAEREKLSVAVDAAKDERDKEVNNRLDKIMAKIAKGKSLTDQEENLLAVAIAAAKD